MQKLTYINAYGDSVVFGGDPPQLLRSVSGFSRPDGKIVTVQGAYQDGTTVQRVQLPARKVKLTFDLPNHSDREAMYRTKAEIERVLSTGRCFRQDTGEMGMLVYQNDIGTWRIKALPDGAITWGTRFLNQIIKNKLNFSCPDPYLADDTLNTATLKMGNGGLILPNTFPFSLGVAQFTGQLVNSGSVESPCEIAIYGTGDTPAVVNHTTGARLIISETLTTGDVMHINTDPNALECYIVHPDGSREDAFGWMDPTIAITGFQLIPGTNSVEYVPSAPTQQSRATIIWRSRVEGIG